MVEIRILVAGLLGTLLFCIASGCTQGKEIKSDEKSDNSVTVVIEGKHSRLTDATVWTKDGKKWASPTHWLGDTDRLPEGDFLLQVQGCVPKLVSRELLADGNVDLITLAEVIVATHVEQNALAINDVIDVNRIDASKFAFGEFHTLPPLLQRSQRVTTGKDGVVRVALLPDCKYSIERVSEQPKAKGFSISQHELTCPAGGVCYAPMITLSAHNAAWGIVVDENEEPIVGAKVVLGTKQESRNAIISKDLGASHSQKDGVFILAGDLPTRDGVSVDAKTLSSSHSILITHHSNASGFRVGYAQILPWERPTKLDTFRLAVCRGSS